MSSRTRPPKTSPETAEQPCPETRTDPDNPPIKRRDGTYRPLDLVSLEEDFKILDETRNPEMDRHEIEFWEEHGLEYMSK